MGGPQVLERLGRIDTVVLDKTGTLTTGEMTVKTSTAPGEDAGEVLLLAAAVEAGSQHPIGAAVRRAAAAYGTPPPAADLGTTAGSGVRERVDGRMIAAGRCGDAEALPGALRDAVHAADERGHTAIVVTVDDRPLSVLAVGDSLRAGADAAVERLRRAGLRTVMATGDRPAPAGDEFTCRPRPGQSWKKPGRTGATAFPGSYASRSANRLREPLSDVEGSASGFPPGGSDRPTSS